MPDSLPQSMLCPILIGRDAQLSALTRLLEQARTSQGHIALISGEAGIGKSRLITEVRQLATEHEFIIFQGTCFEQDSTLPFAPLIDLLQTLPRETTLPAELSELLSGRGVAVEDSEQAKRRLFADLTRFLCNPHSPLTLDHSQLIILEDLHWCDDITLEFLHFFIRTLGDHSVVLLSTFRPDEITPGLARWLAASAARIRLTTEIKLVALSQSEIGEMVRAIFHLPRASQSDFVEVLHQLTGGNPFFVEEVLKTCVDEGSIFQRGGQWGRKPLSQWQTPRTVQLAVQQRMAQLTAVAQKVLTLAAVIGQHWNIDLLLEVANLEEHTLIELLKEAVTAQLVVEESPDHFVFRHALTRQAIYRTLLARERRIHHRLIAERLEQMSLSAGASIASGLNASLAYHFAEAGVWDKTLHYAQRAGEEAQALYAPSAVVEQFSRALAAAMQLGLPPDLHLLRGRGQAYEMLGDFDAAYSDLTTMLAVAKARDEQTLIWQTLLDLGFLWTSRDFGQAGDHFEQALALVRTMGAPTKLAHTLNRVGNWHVNMGEPHKGRRYHEEALTIFQTDGNQQGVAATLDLLAGAAHFAGDLQQGMAYYRQAAEHFRRLGDQRGLSSSLSWLAFQGATALNLMAVVAPPQACIQFGEEALKLARAIQWRPGEAFAMLGLAFAHGARGDLGSALQLAQAALAITEELQHGWASVAGIALGAFYLELGDFQAAQQLLEASIALSHQWHIGFGLYNATSFLALAYLRQGNRERAETLLTARFGELPMPTQPQEWALLALKDRLHWWARAEVALHGDNPATALAIVNGLIAAAGAVAHQPTAVVAKLWLLRGLAELAQNQLAAAVTTLGLAQQAAQQQEAHSLLWRIAVQLGHLQQRLGKRATDEQFSIARTEIITVANTLQDPAQREHFLRYANGYLPAPTAMTPLRTAKAAYDGLTEREREVAALIAQGHTDRQIAEALVLSKRTVSTHVTNILNKLSFSSRTQIAAWAAEKGLLDK